MRKTFLISKMHSTSLNKITSNKKDIFVVRISYNAGNMYI